MRNFFSRGMVFVCMTMIALSLCLWVTFAATSEENSKFETRSSNEVSDASLPTEGGRSVYRLVDCINLALQRNPNVLMAMKKVEEAEGRRIEARAGFLPSLTSSGAALVREQDYATQNGTNPTLSNEDWNVNVRLTQNIYSGGGVRNRFAISKLEKDQRKLEYQEAVDEMVMEVRVVFYEVLEDQMEIEVRRQAVEMLREELKDQKSRYAAGTAPRLNVLRAEVNLANEMPALIDAQNNYRNAMLKLSELMAVPYSVEAGEAPFAIRGSLEYRKGDFSLEDCLAKAEAMRPEMKAKGLAIEVQERQLVVDRSNILPQVNLFAGYDLLDQTDKSLPDSTVGGYVAGVSGTWHIFDGFETSGRLKATRARLASAHLDRDKTRNEVFTEVRSAFLKLEQADATVASQTENATLAKESFTLSKASFDAGLGTQLDIMQARVDLTRAQTSELRAKFDHKAALARLQRAISSEFKIVDDVAEKDATKEQLAEPLPVSPETRNPKFETRMNSSLPQSPVPAASKEEKQTSPLFKTPCELPRRAEDVPDDPPPFVIPRNPSPQPRHLSYRFFEPSIRRERDEMADVPQIIVNPSLAMLRAEEE